ncbi:glycosyltransferase family A protein [Sinorhizobium medicae]
MLRQDYQRVEVIAIDDGSTDRSRDVLERYGKTDSRLSIISRENRGLVASLNEGLALAKGELIARMDADDIAYPSRLFPAGRAVWRRAAAGPLRHRHRHAHRQPHHTRQTKSHLPAGKPAHPVDVLHHLHAFNGGL